MSKPPSCTAGAVDLNKGVDEVLTHKDMWGLLKQVSIPADRDPQAPALKGATTLKLQLGLAGRLMSPPTLSKDSQGMPVLTARVFGWLRRCWPGAQVTSCTVVFNRMSPLHVDRNIGLSYLTGVGDFSGGGLWVATPERSKGSVLNLKNKWSEFDPAVPHRTLPFRGVRGYITFYIDKSAVRMSDQVRRKLAELQVPVPTVSDARRLKSEHGNSEPEKKRLIEGEARWSKFLDDKGQSFAQRCATSSGSWVCFQCRKWGRWSHHHKKWCSSACRKLADRKRQVKKTRCKDCGQVFEQSPKGRPAKRCVDCRLFRPHHS